MVNVYSNNPLYALKQVKGTIDEFENEVRGEPETTDFFSEQLQETYQMVKHIINLVGKDNNAKVVA